MLGCCRGAPGWEGPVRTERRDCWSRGGIAGAGSPSGSHLQAGGSSSQGQAPTGVGVWAALLTPVPSAKPGGLKLRGGCPREVPVWPGSWGLREPGSGQQQGVYVTHGAQVQTSPASALDPWGARWCSAHQLLGVSSVPLEVSLPASPAVPRKARFFRCLAAGCPCRVPGCVLLAARGPAFPGPM